MKSPVILAVALLSSIGLGDVLNSNLIKDSVTCETEVFTKDDLVNACLKALENHNAERTPGGFPHYFSNLEGLGMAKDCDTTALYEYPLLRTIPFPQGGSAGRKRVVVNWVSETDVRICAAMFHKKSDEKFQLCQWQK
ncbi:hypothetical protein ETB97_005559 [Aspergillus alliaceus]|uniref:Uncharacterized protein n=1 Tax=Petromyces alliaceus TaxID=209559 RepID=A0A5N7C7W5_PETAA|nr:uncharacterized protein BDW43DRAFT_277729 [Aspergillus alliaceus]KAB8232863.1 hypothetical protein BDW43DRAFT_277729 [Aspergillus alliaceus]KAE8390231.1 hypothetical protein BDV23DRAFT_155727 [Aspergillus alliaceus]KAF5864994.1 hypothetical protein ETB97_005559 [Aspergillus burnettii]